jgi:hypothetical protein
MEYHEQTPSVLLLHDGELANLAEVVEPLGGIDRRGHPTELDRGKSWDVIVASANRMLELHDHLSDTSAVRIAVLDGDSKTLRKMLYRVDTDLLVRQPVHPAALRLLILHALYRGPEKRRTTRVSMGAQVRFRTGLRGRNAILVELSTRGCRMMVDPKCHRAAPDKLVKIVLPPEVTADNRPLSLRGHVMRVVSADEGPDAIAVLFELLREAPRKRLESIVSAHSQGPAILDESVSRALRAAPSPPKIDEPQLPAPDEHPAPEIAAQRPPDPEAHDDLGGEASSERRIQERHTITRRIIALGDEAARVLIGRDLSIGGMRIEPTPGFALGDQLKVAVHVRADGQPLVVSAEIARDDGPDGMALRFVELSPAAQTCLDEMVGALPNIIESDNSNAGAGLVITEVVERHAS